MRVAVRNFRFVNFMTVKQKKIFRFFRFHMNLDSKSLYAKVQLSTPTNKSKQNRKNIQLYT